MVKQIDKNEARLRRHRRVRNKISGTAARPRLDVFRSAKHIYAQIIDDEQGVTLVSASTMDKDFNGFGGNVEAAAEIGKKIAAKAPEHRYKGENLFFFGQITSKLNTTSKTMTLICVTLVLAIFMRLFCVCEDSVCLAVPAAWGIDLDSLLSHGMS